ncbi:hypothetical protein [Nostoc sp. UHCC 0251]|uniref:hypothetical protein n=1 Tax=Nostoc sp. UHCC 0251 TaxID=3110240 RepID=UPI002B209721|nr:hypothetical protein [Nostoc sp. UHCC 0251]MEA5624864.1 hypothetical protein [Nostoc sp. UHCC 0251]
MFSKGFLKTLGVISVVAIIYFGSNYFRYGRFVPYSTQLENSKTTQTNSDKSLQPSIQVRDRDCLYVPESAIAGKSWQEISKFKEELKDQTGKKCVFFTGG